jgi:hypothetical protein
VWFAQCAEYLLSGASDVRSYGMVAEFFNGKLELHSLKNTQIVPKRIGDTK